MNNLFPVKILVIGVVRNGDTVLMRKKPAGSKPYTETWYSFGCEFVPGEDIETSFSQYLIKYIGITVKPIKRLSWGAEVKEDHYGIPTQFIYLDVEFTYKAGEIRVPDELEKVEWVPIDALKELDIVPPSVALFKELGYIT